jgi:hypothetical protein
LAVFYAEEDTSYFFPRYRFPGGDCGIRDMQGLIRAMDKAYFLGYFMEAGSYGLAYAAGAYHEKHPSKMFCTLHI